MVNETKLHVKWVKVGFTNCYLLEINSGYLMIDAGYTGDYQKFRNRLKKKLDIEVKDIKYLLLTHHHDDHCGFASRILEDTNAIFIIHELALKFISKGEVEQESRPINRRMKFVIGIFEKGHDFVYPPITLRNEDIILKGTEENREILASMGLEGSIIHTPGHTKDGISVVFDDGSVFPGDNTMNSWMFNMFGTKKRPIFVQDFNQVLESWEKYQKMGGKMIYPAHGKPFPIGKLKKKFKKYRAN